MDDVLAFKLLRVIGLFLHSSVLTMGSIVTNELAVFATMTLELTMLPHAFALWIYGDSLMSWAVATSLILVWQVGVRFCFGVDDVFVGLVGPDYDQAKTALGTLVILCLVFALLGTFIGWLLDIEEILPYFALVTSSSKDIGTSLREKVDKKVATMQEKGKKGARAPMPPKKGVSYDDDGGRRVKPTGLNRGEMRNLPRPYRHCFWNTVFFAIGVVLPHLIYSFLLDDEGSHNSIAVPLVILLPFVGYIAAYIYARVKPDPFVWGLHEKNADDITWEDSSDAPDAAAVALATEETNGRILRTILAMGIPHIAGVIVLAVLRACVRSANWSLITACILASLVFVITIVAYAVLYKFAGKERVEKTRKGALTSVAADGEEEEDEEEAPSPPGGAIGNDEASVKSQYFSSGLHSRLQGAGFV